MTRRAQSILLAFFHLVCLSVTQAQQDSIPSGKDTLRSGKDSLKLYKDIKQIAEKKKLTRWIYKSIFTDPPEQMKPVQAPSKSNELTRISNLTLYEGRKIRNIHIITLDPFGLRVYDTLPGSVSPLENAANALHIKSKKITIKNQLLFKKGDAVDALRLKESERILRGSAYVRDAKVAVLPARGSDSVDVIVTVQDIWSISGSAAASTSKGIVNVTEKNFLGFAHQINTTFSYYPGTSVIDYDIGYVIPYIRNTFIRVNANYIRNEISHIKVLGFNRDFYSPLTRYAGGATLIDSRTTLVPQDLHSFQQDYWLGHSFKINPGRTDIARSTRVIAAGRFYNLGYNSTPDAGKDTLSPYINTSSILGSLSFSQRTYYKDNYIYRYGSMEDVPEGRMITLLGGIENRSDRTRYYTALRAAFARHFDGFGYLSSGWDYGIYSFRGRTEKGVISANINYFSDLIVVKPYWNLRQFVYFNLTHGINRDPNERVNLSTNGIYGFSNTLLTGTDKLFLNLQSVLYTPYTFIGFHFAPVVFAGFGMLGSPESHIFISKVYQVYGLGLLIKNENLIVNTIQLSIGFYPNIGEGSGLKLNPASVYDLRFRELFLSKPAEVPYY